MSTHSHHRHHPFAFPHVFATPPQEGRVRIYQATLLQESPGPYSDSPPVYHITPYQIFQPQSHASAFWIPLTEPDDGWDVMFVTDRETHPTPRRYRDGEIVSTWEYPTHGSLTSPTRDVFFHGHWMATGRAILSMFCATAIPILELTGTFRCSWPRHPSPPIPLTAGGPEVLRAWQRRWTPDSWEDAIAREFAEVPLLWEESPSRMPSMDDDTGGVGVGRGSRYTRLQPSLPRSAAAAAAPPPLLRRSTAPTVSSPTIPTIIPTFVQEAIVRDAISRSAACPITMEPITSSTTVTLTPCYHLFDATALTSWRASGEDKCPVCRSAL